MKLVRRDDGDRSAMAAERFTGDVELEMLHEGGSDDRPDVAHVHFHDGAVTNWHTHPGGQHLYVASGTARVGTDASGEVVLESLWSPAVALLVGDGKSIIRWATAIFSGYMVIDRIEGGEGARNAGWRILIMVLVVVLMPIDERRTNGQVAGARPIPRRWRTAAET